MTVDGALAWLRDNDPPEPYDDLCDALASEVRRLTREVMEGATHDMERAGQVDALWRRIEIMQRTAGVSAEALMAADTAEFKVEQLERDLAAARAEVERERIENAHLREAFVTMERAANANEREVARLREAIHRALESLCMMGSEDIDTLTAALAGSSIHCHGCTVSVMPGESSGYSRGFCQRCVNEGRAI